MRIDDGTIDHYKCDACGKDYVYDDALYEVCGHWHGMWKRRQDKQEIPDFCHACAPGKEGFVRALRDTLELRTAVNKLERAINESRKTRNHRPTAHDAGECGKGCAQRRFGHRQSDCLAQAGEEHF